ncbi:hypothetical protein GCM10009555_065160 [Acrocarpospora macrocephala]|uniref:LacI family transcriptional regulator n=1 Tax=Acrocarpospora macrocephala TaxID=150177 RepID=A0A5M3X7Q1_9ACTN|nr:substrate-binding domain-containing protein [Acrocarpospora macrocephala]GES14913.1 hypothetical protein Amac_085100 [Acrocarpospora macrocephala]
MSEQVPDRRERRKALTRRSIADTAQRLFAERGFEAVTVAEIAVAADVAAKTIFNYFPTKEQLFFDAEPKLLPPDLPDASWTSPETLRQGLAEWACATAPLATPAAPPTNPTRPLANPAAPPTNPTRPLANPAGPLANPAGSLANPAVALAERAVVYRDSPLLRAHAREAFAAREAALSRAIEAGHLAISPGVMAALLLAAVREAWESALLMLADKGNPGDAAAHGRRILMNALDLLSRNRAPVRTPRPSSAPLDPQETLNLLNPPKPAQRGDRGGERVSIVRVARVAGVSATTVSHTLNGRRPVAAETRDRVLEAIRQLGYRPNALARGLRTNRSQTIGLVIPDITNPFYPALARGLQDVLRPAGYDEIISNTDGDRTRERAAIEQMIARQVDGLAFAVFHTHAEDLNPAIEAGIPVVRLGGTLVQDGVDLVHSDDEGGAAEATRYLLTRGYRRIGFICGPSAEGPAAERVSGYRSALLAAGVATDPELVAYTHFSRHGGAAGVSRLLDLSEPPDAVLCANDLMAIGALDAAGGRGLHVPGDLAVMGFDDIDAASLVRPRLTTMANPAREIGRACGMRLLERLSGEPAALIPTEIVIPARLVERESA